MSIPPSSRRFILLRTELVGLLRVYAVLWHNAIDCMCVVKEFTGRVSVVVSGVVAGLPSLLESKWTHEVGMLGICDVWNTEEVSVGLECAFLARRSASSLPAMPECARTL